MEQQQVRSLKNEIILLISLFVALLVYVSISTYPLNVLSSVSAFLLVLFFQFYFCNVEPKFHIKIPMFGKRPKFLKILVYSLGLLASLIVLLVPSYNLHLGTEYMWETFASLSPFAIARVVSAYFIVGFFPGYVVYDLFLRKFNFGYLENLCLISALSYVLTTLATLTLFLSGLVMSPFVVIIFIWILVAFLFILSVRFHDGGTSVSKERQFVVLDFKAAFVLLIGIIIMLFAYLQVFSVRPFGGYLYYDVPRYMIEANQFINYGPIIRAPYLWPQIFFWTTSLLTGLPMLYAYAGLQFYQIVLPFSFYFLLYTIFKKKELAMVGTFLFFFAVSTNAVALLWTRINFPSLFGTYMSGDAAQSWNFLHSYYDSKLGTSLVFPIIVSPGSVDFIMAFLGLAFAYKYLTGEKGGTNLLLMALFTAATLFSRNILSFLIILITILVYSLMKGTSKKIVVATLGSIAIFVLFFDFLSRFYFINDSIYRRVLPILLSQPGNPAEILFQPVIVIPVVGLLFYTFLLITRKHFYLGKLGEMGHKISSVLKLHAVSLTLRVLSMFIVLLSLYFTFTNFANLSSRWAGSWYIVISLYFMLIIPLAIWGLPHLSKKISNPSLYLILSLFISLLIVICVSPFSAELMAANFSSRYAILLTLPLVCLATLTLQDLAFGLRSLQFEPLTRWHSYSKALKRVAPFLLSLLIAVSFLSFAYTHEYGLTDIGEWKRLAKPSEIDAYEWMNNHLPKDKTILPLSENSYLTLTSMVSDVRVLPIIWRYSPGSWYPYSWLTDILVNSTSAEVIFYVLNSLNVSYIYATEDDLASLKEDSALKSLVSIFPIVFETGVAKVYSVPSSPFFEDSNYVIVKSAIDEEPKNQLDVVNLLVASGLKFSVIPDLQLSVLKKDHVYFFPFNQHIPHNLLDNIISSVNDGAHVVFFDQSFASFDEFNKDYAVPPVRKLAGEVPKSQVASLRIGNGSITFIDLSSLSKTFYNQTSDKHYLETVMGSLSSLLSKPNLPTSPICLPYPQDLFKYVIPEFMSLWSLKGLHGYGLADQGLTLSGQLTIQSRNTHLIDREMMAENVTIFSNTTGITFQRIKLGDIRLMGDCVILSNSSEVVIGGSSLGSFTYLDIKPKGYNEIRLTNSYGEVILEKDSGLERVALYGENLTIFTINEYGVLAEQPAITVNGFLDGNLLAAFSFENRFFATECRENISFDGSFVFKALYDSGQILFKIQHIKHINIKEK